MAAYDYIHDGAAIYERSFAIIRAEADLSRFSEAEADVASGRCEAIAFGRPYISNPDLAERIRVGAEWAPNVNVPASWYLPGPAGYIDYPTMDEAALDAAE